MNGTDLVSCETSGLEKGCAHDLRRSQTDRLRRLTAFRQPPRDTWMSLEHVSRNTDSHAAFAIWTC